MIYVYDIVVNFSDNERIYEFFEWKKTDVIEQVRRIPLIRINTKLMDHLLTKNIKVTKEFLDIIYKKCEIYKDTKIKTIEYATLFTDQSRVIAVEFDQRGKSICKSFLLLDEEEEILDVADELTEKSIAYQIIKENQRNHFITREEEMIQKYLLKELKYTYRNNLEGKIKYLYEEVFDQDELSIEQKYHRLIKNIQDNYERKYKKLYDILRMAHTKK